MPSIKISCPKTRGIFGEIFYPGLEVEVLLLHPTGYQPFEFILDSGADCTIVPRYMATLTGIKLPRRANAHMTGVSGKPNACFKGKLNMRLQGQEFEVRCLFTYSNRTPFLLGRVDFFSIFQVSFDGNSCDIILTKRA